VLNSSRVTMEFLDSWVVPGTSMRAVVTQSSESKSIVQFTPVKSSDVAPAPPVVTSPSALPPATPFAASWASGANDANLLGHIVKWTDDGMTRVFRVPASTTSVPITALSPNTTGTLKVWAVSKQGLLSKPTTVSVQVQFDFLRFSYNGTVVFDATSTDPWNSSANVTGVGDLTWTIDSTKAAQVTGWAIHVDMPDGSSYDYHFSADSRKWTLPNEVLAALDPTKNPAGFPLTFTITLEGLGRSAVLVLYPVLP